MHLGFPKDRGHRFNLDPHDPCNFRLSGFPIETRYRGIFAGFLPQKEVLGIGLPKGNEALTLALGIIGANRNAPQPLPPLFHFTNAKGGLQRFSRYQTGSALYDLGFKY